MQPELHSRYASERLKDDHGARRDDPTDEGLVEVDEDSAQLPAAEPVADQPRAA